MKRHTIIFASWLVLIASPISVFGKAQIEEWRSQIDCGGLKFFVISQCKSSGDPFELNECLPNQKLVLGDKSVNIPASDLRNLPTRLYATYWHCIESPHGVFIRLGFNTGQGRDSKDEGTEFFDSQLRVVQDRKLIDDLFRRVNKARKGFVRSIMPGEGN